MRRRTRSRLLGISTLAVSITLGLGAATVVGADAKPPTRGRIPESAFDGKGGIDERQVPEYIPALDRDGNEVGWIRYGETVTDADDPERSNQPVAVYADDLKTRVGAMWPGVGYVPNGKTPADAGPPGVHVLDQDGNWIPARPEHFRPPEGSPAAAAAKPSGG
jgi:hypothetical protein